MDFFTIKDLENISGIKAHTIRIWEQRYEFLKPNRTDTNIRTYTNQDLKRVLNIALLNKYGFKISHIDKMNEGEREEKIRSLSDQKAQNERVVNDLVKFMIDVQVEKIDQVLENHISLTGVEQTITQIIFPFMEKIGILWVTNHINPAQEHLVSNLIRQKLIVGIDKLVIDDKTNKSALLFLPEGEFHELGLLFVCYLLKRKGIYPFYLGANMPIKDVQYLVDFKKPDFIYSHLTSVGKNFSFDKFLLEIKQRLNNTPVVLSGLLANTYEKKIPQHIQFKKTLAEVMDFIAEL
ncbi:MAG: MerR family transcriptional regulator [Chitinophagia bacterium]|nr:MerR family transcriptional regulator [Chitinophagia bacterium]